MTVALVAFPRLGESCYFFTADASLTRCSARNIRAYRGRRWHITRTARGCAVHGQGKHRRNESYAPIRPTPFGGFLVAGVIRFVDQLGQAALDSPAIGVGRVNAKLCGSNSPRWRRTFS